MPGHIPGRRDDRWYDKKWLVELFAVVPPVAAGAIAALVHLDDPAKRRFGPWLVGVAAWLVIGSVAKILNARSQDKERKRAEDYAGFLGALYVLWHTVAARAGISDMRDGRFRVTIHRVVLPAKTDKKKGPDTLEQLLPYLGGGGGGAGRTFAVQSGIIGKAVREREPFAAVRKSEEYEQFVRELVGEWSFTEHDARGLRADRRSWMAVPLDGGHKVGVVAVVYLDSSIGDFFTDEIKNLVLDACGGFAAYTLDAY